MLVSRSLALFHRLFLFNSCTILDYLEYQFWQAISPTVLFFHYICSILFQNFILCVHIRNILSRSITNFIGTCIELWNVYSFTYHLIPHMDHKNCFGSSYKDFVYFIIYIIFNVDIDVFYGISSLLWDLMNIHVTFYKIPSLNIQRWY